MSRKDKITLMSLGLMIVVGLLLFEGIQMVSAETETQKVGVVSNLQFTCTLNNAIPSALTTYNISLYAPNGTILLNNQPTTSQGSGSFNYSYTFNEVGLYKVKMFCSDGTYSFGDEGFYDITPTGVATSDTGQLSTGILYFFIILSIIFLFLGYLFLRSPSLWICYSGLFMMILGFTFVYYALHLSNVYATTIAINSGADNVTTSVFVRMIAFLKVAPYIVAGIIAFFSVKTLRMAINKKKGSDGWDNNEYK